MKASEETTLFRRRDMPRNEVVRIGDVLALADLDAGGYVVGDAVVSDSLAVAVAEEEEFRPSLSPHDIASAQ